MSWRFRRRIKLLPGLWLNASKRGISASIGGHGATINLSRKGAQGTLSAQGTGVSYRTRTTKWKKTHGSSNAPRPLPAKSGSSASVLAFVMVLAAVLWILSHWH
jgi:Protein of unknown function (DUF4236)